MKSIVIAAVATVALLGGVAQAAPSKGPKAAKAQPVKVKVISTKRGGTKVVIRQRGTLTRAERRLIAKSRTRLDRLKRRVRADGIVTRSERRAVRVAQVRHNRLVGRARRN